MTTEVPSNFSTLSVAELLLIAAPPSERVVGYYAQGSYDFPVGAGVEGVYFRGVDRQTGELVQAFYAGATVGISAVPGTLSGGIFYFSGSPDGLGGWSIGAQANGIVSGGLSISSGGTLKMIGVAFNVGAGANAGYTYRVEVGDTVIYQFGEIKFRGTGEFDGSQYGDALQWVENGRGNAIVSWQFEDNGVVYTVTQVFQYVGNSDGTVFSNICTSITDENGDRMGRAFLGEYGFGDGSDVIAIENGGLVDKERCFLAGTSILLSDGEVKSIEDVVFGDLVLSYDSSGALVPGRVTRTFRNEVSHLLDVHGLKVTPGHATLCGDGMFAGRHVPIIDILLSDGALVKADGTLIRMGSNAPVGSVADAFVQVAVARTPADMQNDILTEAEMRVGTLLFDREGTPISVLDCLTAEGYAFDPETGLIAKPGEAPHPLFWFGRLPRPEDYILTRSQESLEGILTDGEWEGSRSALIAGRLRQTTTMWVNLDGRDNKTHSRLPHCE
jgi:hypothetical protein